MHSDKNFTALHTLWGAIKNFITMHLRRMHPSQVEEQCASSPSLLWTSVMTKMGCSLSFHRLCHKKGCPWSSASPSLSPCFLKVHQFLRVQYCRHNSRAHFLKIYWRVKWAGNVMLSFWVLFLPVPRLLSPDRPLHLCVCAGVQTTYAPFFESCLAHPEAFWNRNSASSKDVSCSLCGGENVGNLRGGVKLFLRFVGSSGWSQNY